MVYSEKLVRVENYRHADKLNCLRTNTLPDNLFAQCNFYLTRIYNPLTFTFTSDLRRLRDLRLISNIFYSRPVVDLKLSYKYNTFFVSVKKSTHWWMWNSITQGHFILHYYIENETSIYCWRIDISIIDLSILHLQKFVQTFQHQFKMYS